MTLPHWPAMLSRQLAAGYCGLSVAAFEREVTAGRLPLPVKLGNRELWNKAKVDAALERIASGEDDWEARLNLYAA
jgi:predicted DNA-binding transcriptional regulator AlpA